MTVFGLNADYQANINKNNRYKYVNNLFLYGQLATENNFDVAGADDALFDTLKNNASCSIDVSTVLSNGSIYVAKLFWWHDASGRQHGLVVRADDSKACRYAQHHMENNAPYLNYNWPPKKG